VAGTDDRGQAGEVDALLLAELLRTCDRLAQVREQLSSDGLTVTGSQDQTRPHPLLGIERQLVAELAARLERLRRTPARRPFGAATRPDGRLGRIDFKTGLIA
jgi:Phage terminase, small subunit